MGCERRGAEAVMFLGIGCLGGFPSFPNSVWERFSSKLRFEAAAKQSLAGVRSQTEFWNEVKWRSYDGDDLGSEQPVTSILLPASSIGSRSDQAKIALRF